MNMIGRCGASSSYGIYLSELLFFDQVETDFAICDQFGNKGLRMLQNAIGRCAAKKSDYSSVVVEG
jgi:hypothetical protein